MTFSDNYANSRYPYFEQIPKQAYTQPHYIQQPVPVKVEANDPPNLHAATQYPQQSLAQFNQKHTVPLYRFGNSGDASPSPTTPSSSFTFMSSHPWPPLSSAASASAAGSAYQHQHQHQHQHQYATDRMHGYSMQQPVNGHSHTHAQMTLTDEYDDGEDDGLSDLPSAGGLGVGINYSGSGFGGSDVQGSGKGEKQVRRRSSKACDQCRKSKCKCERTNSQDPCRNCVMLGTACTFLGPSRKRGPPKGYIDAIEARLHQTEALIGILLSSKDSRAKTLLDDLREDSLAKEIINRVDNGSYGHKGRLKSIESSNSSRTRPPPTDSKESDGSSLPATHPSSEWQDLVIAQLNTVAAERNTLVKEDDQAFEDSVSSALPASGGGGAGMDTGPSETSSTIPHPSVHSDEESGRPRANNRPTLTLHPLTPNSAAGPSSSLLTPYSATAAGESDSDQNQSSARRQRRRVDPPEREHDHARRDSLTHQSHLRSPSSTSASGRSRSPVQYALPPLHPALLNPKRSQTSVRDGTHASLSPEAMDGDADEESVGGDDNGSGEDELAVAVGQLSINEDEQLRYHGKASGLHLLGISERVDGRNEGGIWRFPKARVWPPLPPAVRRATKTEQDWISHLPDLGQQEHLLELYWVYVHPALPILHKKVFMETFREVNMRYDTVNTPSSQQSDSSSPSSTSKPHRIPAILLLVMFSIAARYSTVSISEIPPPEEGSMWAAGDRYLESAKTILDCTYANSRPTTCQALLLMGYREVGIGAMAQAWLYVGMAVRMAQDLGMHKCADKWSNVGRALFSHDELQERRRLWYGCVVMDKYVSAYIGRPVAIFENDFDTELPCTNEPDELEMWLPHPSLPVLDDPLEVHPRTHVPVPANTISCFNENAKLSIILSMIVQTIYPIRRHVFRSSEYSRLEKLLDKWYLELPEHLRFDPASQKDSSLPPHCLTLHLHYWCTVLLLHRPFIRHLSNSSNHKSVSSPTKEQEIRASSRKTYDLCVQAANHIASIVSVYAEKHCPRRASVFLCYYVFTAAIMHVATLTTYPSDPQASVGLHKCMDILHRMQNVWPSAWRAYQLLHGSKVQTQQLRVSASPSGSDRRKRSADHVLDHPATNPPEPVYRESHGYARVNNSTHPQQGFPLGLDLPQVEPPTFFQSFDRWAPESTLNNFSGGGLSTSVLPQQYSTGLVDDRIQRNPERSAQRFPQYWHDYSALGQMESAYGVPPGEMVSANSGPPPSRSSHSGPVYPQDQYIVFNNIPPGGQ